jgi:indole-3-glycerol phosphate synthase
VSGNILDQIVARKQERLEEARRRVPLEALTAQVAPAVERGKGQPGPFETALRHSGIQIIAEIKRRSPSKGVIRPSFDPVTIARNYQAHGAAAISCLTEEDFFDGSLDHLRAIRTVTTLPILRKDFLFDRYQLWEARHAGADAVLLIAAMLSPGHFEDLLLEAYAIGLDVLVEVHDEEEMEMVLRYPTRILGVNNRNLRTFETTLETSRRLAANLPRQAVLVSESGIRTRADLAYLQEAGFDAFLIGEELMRAPDEGVALRALIG